MPSSNIFGSIFGGLPLTGGTLTPPPDTSALVITGYSVSGSGTTPAINVSGTWNTTGIADLAVFDVTNTASNAISRLIDLRVGGTSQFQVLRGGAVSQRGPVLVLSATAIPAGGTAGSGFRFFQTTNFGIFGGSGAPTLAAAKGSLYLRSDGTTTNNRAYINTDGSTTWTALMTEA